MKASLNENNVATDCPTSLWTLFWLFFCVAWTSFGGFMAMIAAVQNAIVERRKLMSPQDMLDGISLASLLPGPVAVNVVAYVGYRLRGANGALVSGIASVLPAFVLIVLLSSAYFRWGNIPAVGKVFSGFVPAVTAIIAAAAWNMSQKSVTGLREGVLAIAAAATLLCIGGFFSTLSIIVGSAAIGWWWFREEPVLASSAQDKPEPRIKRKAKIKRKTKRSSSAPGANMGLFLLGGFPGAIVPLMGLEPGILLKVFFTFAGMSLLLFGGAYVFIPLMQEIVVDGHGWVTHQEFVDAVAMGQVMPGPVLVSVAFIGLKVGGLAGAGAATVGIFLPSAIVMIVCSGLLERVKESVVVKAALRGVRPAVVGMVAAAVVTVAKAASPTWMSALIFAVALVALLRFRIEAVWIILVAGALGYSVY
jgi:chromate transporter